MPSSRPSLKFINTASGLDDACAAMEASASLALDTEFARTHTFRSQLCLIQVGTDAEVYCIDALADLDLAPLWQLIGNSKRKKLLHAAKQDIEVLQQNFGPLEPPLFDTQVAAALLGHPAQVGYAGLAATELDIQLDKSQTRTDWSRRPLSPAQLSYAANDVIWLPALAGNLRQQLREAGREAWALEDCAALLDPSLYALRPEDAWERLGHLEYLPVPVQARARRLAAWRERRADASNRPRRWILADQLLMALATENPRNQAGLRAVGVEGGLLRHSGAALLQELKEADAALSAGALSGLVQLPRPTAEDNRKLKQLAKVAREEAEALDIAAEILATRAELAALLRGDRDLRVLRGWRREIVGEALLAALP